MPLPRQVANSALDLIGNTPVVELRRMQPVGAARIVAKLESQNPGGSIKDRICLAMIEAAESSGELRPGGTIVEPTSGNTGIGLAVVAAAKGYRTLAVARGPESGLPTLTGLVTLFDPPPPMPASSSRNSVRSASR